MRLIYILVHCQTCFVSTLLQVFKPPEAWITTRLKHAAKIEKFIWHETIADNEKCDEYYAHLYVHCAELFNFSSTFFYNE